MATVLLRERREDDLDMLYRLFAELGTFEERNSRPPEPLTRAAFDKRPNLEGDGESVKLVVEADGEAVGDIALFHVDRFARHAEAGISLLPEARGKGIGTAALQQLVEFAFVRQNLRRVHLQTLASNAGAIRAYEKAGFVVEGRLREHAWVRGRYEDIVLMGVLRGA